MSDQPVTLSDNRDNYYPVLKTRRVSLSQRGGRYLVINIDYSINLVRPGRQSQDVLTEFMNHRSGNSTIKVCFMVLDERTKSLVSDMATKSMANKTIRGLPTDPRFTYLQETNGLHKVLLRDVIHQSVDRINYTTVTDLGGATRYETHNTLEIQYDMKHNKGILDNPGMSIFSEEFSAAGVDFLESLHLVGYLELPHDRLDRVDNLPPELVNMPITEITYDLLLENAGILRAPTTRQIFFVDDSSLDFQSINLQPYSGPAFFDRASGRWRAGANQRSAGPTLSVRTVRNRKIVIDAPPVDLNPPRAPIGPIGVDLETAGQSLERYVESLPTTATYLNPEVKVSMMVAKSIQSSARNSNAFIEPWTPVSAWITKDDNLDDELLESSYNSIIGIKYFDLIKQNSILGELLDYHDQNKANPLSAEILLRVYTFSKILKMTVIRRRLSSQPYSHSPQDSKDYADFQENQENKIVIESSDDSDPSVNFLLSGILPASLPAAEISEVRLDFDDSDLSADGQAAVAEANDTARDAMSLFRATRSFLVRDYELFYNLDFGKYTYDVDIMIKDGMKELLQSYTNGLRTSLRVYNNLLKQLSIPIRKDEASQRDIGSYDYYAKRFSGPSVTTLKDDFSSATETLINQVRKSVYFMTATDPFDGTQGVLSAEDLKDKLNITMASTKLEDLEYFSEKVGNVLQSLETIAKDTFIRSDLQANNNTEEVHVPNATGHNASIIRAYAKTGIVHDAESTTKLMADYGSVFRNFLTDDLTTFINTARARIAARNLSPETLGGLNLPQVATGPLQADFPTPFDDSAAPGYRDLVDFDDALLQPVEFSVIPARRLQLEPDPRLSPQDFDPSVPTSRRITQKSTITNSDFDAPGHVIKIKGTEFYEASTATKSIQQLKIFKMMSPESHTMGLASKGLDFDYSYLSSRVAGITSAFGSGPSSQSLRSLGETALRLSAIDDSYLSKEVKSAILESIVEEKDDKKFTDLIENRFKDLTKIRDSLKKTYDIFNRLLSVSRLGISSDFYNRTAEREYSLGKNTDTLRPELQLQKDPFQSKQAVLTTFSKTGEVRVHPTKQTLNNLVGKRASTGAEVKKVKLLKFETSEEKDNTASVNNAILLEIK